MAIPKTLKEITETKALSYMRTHKGEWERGCGFQYGGDWVEDYDFTSKKSPKMLRLTCICGRREWEIGKVSM